MCFLCRFSCISRTYKYFFPVATLDIEVYLLSTVCLQFSFTIYLFISRKFSVRLLLGWDLISINSSITKYLVTMPYQHRQN